MVAGKPQAHATEGTSREQLRRPPAPISRGPRRLVFAVLGALWAGLVFPGCTSGTAATLDEAVVLKPGESVTIGDTTLRLRFDAVSEDSRCPASVQCITAGNARVRLSAALGAGEDAQVELNTSRGRKDAEVGDFRVVLEKVDPYPESSGSISPDQYRITISVQRR